MQLAWDAWAMAPAGVGPPGTAALLGLLLSPAPLACSFICYPAHLPTPRYNIHRQ